MMQQMMASFESQHFWTWCHKTFEGILDCAIK